MRLKITLRQTKPEQVIPLNYQYPLSTVIYKIIESSNSEYAKWLHDKGFINGNKRFKFFTFSSLRVKDYEIKGNKMILKSRYIDFTISIVADETLENFVVGMFKNKKISIFDSITRADFEIKTVEKEVMNELKEEMKFRTISPVVLSKRTEYNGKDSEKYLSPYDEEYKEFIKKNLEEKYLAYAITLNKPVNDLKFEEFELIGEPRSKLISVREGDNGETKIKGYMFDFRLKADPRLIDIGYSAGFGKLCSLGMGCVKVIE
jgi:CRISPR-associated endoribonuclease Cas6